MFDLTEIKKKNICIMGLMGSGKSIIGKDLSKYLNLKFYDTDNEIELKMKKSISTIFKEEGESYFRDIEEKVCIEILTIKLKQLGDSMGQELVKIIIWHTDND